MEQFVLFHFSALRGLIPSSGSLPAADELIWTILLVHYLPELYPEVVMNAMETPWQGCNDFKIDYDFACTRAAKLWSWLNDRVFDESQGWDRLTKDSEIDAWHVIENYQDPEATPYVPKKLKINFMCISPSHLHDWIFPTSCNHLYYLFHDTAFVLSYYSLRPFPTNTNNIYIGRYATHSWITVFGSC